MKIMKQLLILFSVCLTSTFIAELLPFTFPSSVLGLLLLLLLFILKIIKPESLQECAQFLLGNMAIFFLPTGVNILENIPIIKSNLIPIIIICIVSTCVTFLISSFTVLLVMKLKH
ncbi:MAG: CidA/LrgA family protein [Lachnospiraceae bacterium]|nr:CidA/LrgA family protein [Lachnospiraceae bacterium]